MVRCDFMTFLLLTLCLLAVIAQLTIIGEYFPSRQYAVVDYWPTVFLVG
jgi:hypothetical protein